MRSNRRTDTLPERVLRVELHRRGLRFRKDLPIRLPVQARIRPDVVFTRSKLAVFVDGCFWHRCPLHGTMPKSNTDYWEPKLRANVARDRRVDELLKEHGWTVVRLWEHEDPSEAADRVAEVVRRLRTAAAGRRAA
jgi:DNA mismatch endonuclease (patch repair protein)